MARLTGALAHTTLVGMALYSDDRLNRSPSVGRMLLVVITGILAAVLAGVFAIAMALREQGRRAAPPHEEQRPAASEPAENYEIEIE